jgi:hypothetical protein
LIAKLLKLGFEEGSLRQGAPLAGGRGVHGPSASGIPCGMVWSL